ncbi:Cro/CI family transcriptional regulator [Pseudomonas sp. CFII64]|uniref:helix-turn-helix domain-containing protein n=1 Tax=Pseudomonas sp. CFII64 TaxID=911242 RepID=UPI000357B780|nr:helix-turn-helix transcriptional regulator [Pseudomonas sp. CFII64]EPJ88100.1 Cro/CI family transcriptional regulator [Pseudomonas sp. CFII64]
MTGIGQRLKKERLRLKLSQSALGAIGGVETNAQGNYENGIRSPRADYLARIAAAGVDVGFVVTGFVLPSLADSEEPMPQQTPVLEAPSGDSLPVLIGRLQGSLHDISDHLYQMTRLADARIEPNKTGTLQTQLDTIKRDAEAIALASVRLIFVTSRLN